MASPLSSMPFHPQTSLGVDGKNCLRHQFDGRHLSTVDSIIPFSVQYFEHPPKNSAYIPYRQSTAWLPDYRLRSLPTTTVVYSVARIGALLTALDWCDASAPSAWRRWWDPSIGGRRSGAATTIPPATRAPRSSPRGREGSSRPREGYNQYYFDMTDRHGEGHNQYYFDMTPEVRDTTNITSTEGHNQYYFDMTDRHGEGQPILLRHDPRGEGHNQYYYDRGTQPILLRHDRPSW
eukprot:1176988-Prorocentrum_minimum.AAC.1